MLIYDFIWRRLDQIECSDGLHAAQYMVNELWDANYLTFRQEDKMVNDVCQELYHELESVANEDIPF